MAKTLIIAEKPSVARDMSLALGNISKKGNWYEDDKTIIASAIGHLVELFMPEDMDGKFRFWRLDPLPILPDRFKLKPIQKTRKKFEELKKLMHRKDVSRVINACDAGREGELIFTYLYEMAKCGKPVLRLWMQSMTRQAIREAHAHPRKGEQMKGLRDAARCRSEADWLIGINGTRAITTRIYGRSRGNVATVGRVQTPTLNLVVERERRIAAFQSRPYWRIQGKFSVKEGIYEGLFQRRDFKKASKKESPKDASFDSMDKADRIWEREEAERILGEAIRAESAEVREENKRTTQIAPRLYDLTSLQREANGRYGMSARRTLQIAQALYEKHKMITYPRTDSRALPEDYIPTTRKILASLEHDLSAHARKALEKEWVKPNRRIFNNRRISDHFAIIPTGEEKQKLNADEYKIYDMVARRFVAVFFPIAEFDVTTRITAPGGHAFKTEGKVLLKPGWLEVYGKNVNSADHLVPLTAADGSPPEAKVVSLELKEEATKPPPRYTEATLLSAMEGAGKFVDDEELAEAMKDKGIGTPATRAQIIEQLIKQKYMERNRRQLVPTAKAQHLIEFLNALKIDDLTSPTMTGDWEYKLHRIETGTLSRDEFMSGITALTEDLVRKTKEFKEEEAGSRVSNIISPTDNKPMLETLRAYKSQDNAFQIYKIMGNRKFEEEEIQTLIKQRQIGPLDGFRSKIGKPFSAELRLNDQDKVEFVFARNDSQGGSGDPGEVLDLSKLPVLGTCPKDGGKVLETPKVFACQHFLEGNRACDFRISRVMLKQTLSRDQMVKLLEDGKTDLIQNFRSNRTGKYFSAYLVLKNKGKIGFEFPPRPVKKKTP